MASKKRDTKRRKVMNNDKSRWKENSDEDPKKSQEKIRGKFQSAYNGALDMAKLTYYKEKEQETYRKIEKTVEKDIGKIGKNMSKFDQLDKVELSGGENVQELPGSKDKRVAYLFKAGEVHQLRVKVNELDRSIVESHAKKLVMQNELERLLEENKKYHNTKRDNNKNQTNNEDGNSENQANGKDNKDSNREILFKIDILEKKIKESRRTKNKLEKQKKELEKAIETKTKEADGLWYPYKALPSLPGKSNQEGVSESTKGKEKEKEKELGEGITILKFGYHGRVKSKKKAEKYGFIDNSSKSVEKKDDKSAKIFLPSLKVFKSALAPSSGDYIASGLEQSSKLSDQASSQSTSKPEDFKNQILNYFDWQKKTLEQQRFKDYSNLKKAQPEMEIEDLKNYLNELKEISTLESKINDKMQEQENTLQIETLEDKIDYEIKEIQNKRDNLDSKNDKKEEDFEDSRKIENYLNDLKAKKLIIKKIINSDNIGIDDEIYSVEKEIKNRVKNLEKIEEQEKKTIDHYKDIFGASTVAKRLSDAHDNKKKTVTVKKAVKNEIREIYLDLINKNKKANNVEISSVNQLIEEPNNDIKKVINDKKNELNNLELEIKNLRNQQQSIEQEIKVMKGTKINSEESTKKEELDIKINKNQMEYLDLNSKINRKHLESINLKKEIKQMEDDYNNQNISSSLRQSNNGLYGNESDFLSNNDGKYEYSYDNYDYKKLPVAPNDKLTHEQQSNIIDNFIKNDKTSLGNKLREQEEQLRKAIDKIPFEKDQREARDYLADEYFTRSEKLARAIKEDNNKEDEIRRWMEIQNKRLINAKELTERQFLSRIDNEDNEDNEDIKETYKEYKHIYGKSSKNIKNEIKADKNEFEALRKAFIKEEPNAQIENIEEYLTYINEELYKRNYLELSQTNKEVEAVKQLDDWWDENLEKLAHEGDRERAYDGTGDYYSHRNEMIKAFMGLETENNEDKQGLVNAFKETLKSAVECLEEILEERQIGYTKYTGENVPLEELEYNNGNMRKTIEISGISEIRTMNINELKNEYSDILKKEGEEDLNKIEDIWSTFHNYGKFYEDSSSKHDELIQEFVLAYRGDNNESNETARQNLIKYMEDNNKPVFNEIIEEIYNSWQMGEIKELDLELKNELEKLDTKQKIKYEFWVKNWNGDITNEKIDREKEYQDLQSQLILNHVKGADNRDLIQELIENTKGRLGLAREIDSWQSALPSKQ